MYLNTSNRFTEHMTAENRNIAILSYDKRGVGKSLRVPHDKNFFNCAGMLDLVNDAVEAVRFVAEHPKMWVEFVCAVCCLFIFMYCNSNYSELLPHKNCTQISIPKEMKEKL